LRFHRTLCALGICLASLAAVRPALAKWPMYNSDAAGSRTNPRERKLGPATVGSLHVRWTFPTAGAVSATPVVSGSRVYVGDQSGHVHALAASDGRLLWTTPVVGPVTASALIGKRVVVGDLAGYVYGLDRRSGAIVWQIRPNAHPLAQIYGSATTIGRYAAIGVASIEAFATADPTYSCCSARGSVVLLDPRDGRIVWQTYMISDTDHAAGASGASVWSTPTYDKRLGLVYVTTGQNFSAPATGTSDAILALDAKTGAIRWVNQRLPNDIWNIRFPQGPPDHPDYDIGDSAQVYTLPGGQKVVGAGQKSGFFHVLDAATGALVAVEQFVPGGGNGGLFADSAVAGGIVFANGSDWPAPNPPVTGSLIAFTGDASQELWRFDVPGTANLSGVAVANGVVYFESYGGTLYALSAATGAPVAAVAIGPSASGPAIDRGQVYAGTGDPFPLVFTGTPAPGSVIALGP
jgi:polyvinyl alcohol dehydrogenase (cytochrome)